MSKEAQDWSQKQSFEYPNGRPWDRGMVAVVAYDEGFDAGRAEGRREALEAVWKRIDETFYVNSGYKHKARLIIDQLKSEVKG